MLNETFIFYGDKMNKPTCKIAPASLRLNFNLESLQSIQQTENFWRGIISTSRFLLVTDGKSASATLSSWEVTTNHSGIKSDQIASKKKFFFS